LRIDSIKIVNFRNLNSLSLAFAPEGLLVFGKNGIGKTNLLEAIAFFSFGKSFRITNDYDAIEFGKQEFMIEASFYVHSSKKNIKIYVSANKKVIKIDGQVVKRTNELYKFVKAVYFSPSDIDIPQGYPNNRRRFFDIAITQYRYSYLEALKQFKNILKQRNALLKKGYQQFEKDIWDKQYIAITKTIILERLAYLEQFNSELKKYYNAISGQKEDISVSYHPSYPNSADKIEEILNEELTKKQNEERILQRTLFGAHLHDYIFKINNLSLKKFGSQGQKRSFVIALRLAQAKLIRLSNNDTPILIFDDILSELDSIRTLNIFNLLEKTHQIFIATPNKESYNSFNIPTLNLETTLTK